MKNFCSHIIAFTILILVFAESATATEIRERLRGSSYQCWGITIYYFRQDGGIMVGDINANREEGDIIPPDSVKWTPSHVKFRDDDNNVVISIAVNQKVYGLLDGKKHVCTKF